MFKIKTLCERFKYRLHDPLVIRPSKKKDTMIGLYFSEDGKFIMWLSNDQIRMLLDMETPVTDDKLVNARLLHSKQSYYEGFYEVAL